MTHVGSLIPLAWLFWDWWFYLLGPNQIQAITIRTGQAAIILLALSLAGYTFEHAVWLETVDSAATAVRSLRFPLCFFAPAHFPGFRLWLELGLDSGGTF